MTTLVKIVRRPDMKMLSAIHSASFHKGWSPDYFKASLRVEGTLALVTQGGFTLMRMEGSEARIVSLAVAPERRGQGLGKALLAAVLSEAKKRKATRVSLNVNERNVAGVGLYAAHGFSQADCLKAYYSNPDGIRSDGLVMQYDFNA